MKTFGALLQVVFQRLSQFLLLILIAFDWFDLHIFTTYQVNF